MFIQQESDMLCSYDDLVDVYKDMNIIKTRGSDHSYDNYNELKIIIENMQF